VALGTVAVVGGLVLSSGDDLLVKDWYLDRRSLLGYLTGLGAAASYGGSNLVAKSLSQEFGSPLVVAAFGTFFGMIVLWPLAGRGALAGLKTAKLGLSFVALSGVASSLGVITLYFALLRSDVVIVAPIASISPLVLQRLLHEGGPDASEIAAVEHPIHHGMRQPGAESPPPETLTPTRCTLQLINPSLQY